MTNRKRWQTVNKQNTHADHGYTRQRSVDIPYVVPSTIGYHSNSWASCYCIQGEGQGGDNAYQGLDSTDMEPEQVAPPDHYTVLGSQEAGAALNRHGYIEVIADSESDDHSQVCCTEYIIYKHILCKKSFSVFLN